jgi:SAM-dependent methyltransferase
MTQEKNERGPTFDEALKKYVTQSMFGFQVVLLYGLGRKLGIFNYLLEKANKTSEKNRTSVTFTPDELSQELALNSTFLDGWLHMALTCGIFIHDTSHEQGLETAPYIFELLIDPKNMLYSGNYLGLFYTLTNNQEELVNNFKTGQTINHQKIPKENRIKEHKLSARLGKKNIELFTENYRPQVKKLQEGGSLLEVGCGFGFNLQNWVKEFPEAKIIGIDIDLEAIKYINKELTENKRNKKIEVFFTDLKNHRNNYKENYDVILLQHVLHEMDPSEKYRREVFKDLYRLLSDEGVVIVVEPMIPSLYTEKQPHFDVILHKWYEIIFGSTFYDKKSFEELVKSTPFSQVEFVQTPTPQQRYFWALKK